MHCCVSQVPRNRSHPIGELQDGEVVWPGNILAEEVGTPCGWEAQATLWRVDPVDNRRAHLHRVDLEPHIYTWANVLGT
jgi:hypothetical protein